MKTTLVALAAVSLALVAAPANAEDKRPCVSKVEFNSVSEMEPKADLEARWDVVGMGERINAPVFDSVVVYPRCGYSKSEAWYGVHYDSGTNGRLLWATGVASWRDSEATPHGHE